MEKENERSQNRSLFDRLTLRRNSDGTKNYVEIFLIPSVTVILSAVIMLSLLLHVLNFGGITKSTQKREKLADSIANIQIIDNAKSFKSTEYLKMAMDEFFSSTGVSPCIYVLSDGENKSVQDAYYENCASENCFFVMFDVKNNTVSAVSGTSAVSVMDSQAYEIFSDYVSYYVDIVESDEELLEYSLRATATRIMTKTNLLNCVPAPYYYGIIVAALIIVFFVIRMIKDIKLKNKNKDKE